MNRLSLPFAVILLFIGFFSMAQSADQPYVKTTELLEPVDITTYINNYATVRKLESVVYFDGFGKQKQAVALKQTPNQKDMIQHIDYDAFGRSAKQYLPLPTTQSTGNFMTGAASQTVSYYYANFGDKNPYTDTAYDDSPLNRKTESAAPGELWQIITGSDTDHTTKFSYGSNTVADEIIRFVLNDTNPNYPLQVLYYPANTLLKTSSKNENWTSSDGLLNTMDVYTDKGGKKICEFTYVMSGGNVKKLKKYYIYDDVGNLRYILPPKIFDTPLLAISNYTQSWPINDFLSQGDAAASTVVLTIANGKISLKTGRQLITSVYDKQLSLQTVKVLATSSPVPDMFLGPVDGVVGMFITDPIYEQLGEAKIINGNLVIDGISNSMFSNLSINLEQDLATFAFTKDLMDHLAFQYKYDAFGRRIEQKIPGKGWEFVVYDKLDRAVLTQDAFLKAQNKWLFNKYDAFGRIIYNGLYSSANNRATIQAQLDNFDPLNPANMEKRTVAAASVGGVAINYSNVAFPNSAIEVLRVNYFDNYTFTDANLPSPLPVTILGQSVTLNTKGLLTASWIKTLGSSSWAKEYSFYDIKGRIIHNYSKNYLDGYTKIEHKLDFRGKVIQTLTTHKRASGGQEVIVNDLFEYDHAERSISHHQRINAQPYQMIYKNQYNELGQVVSKGVGGVVTNPSPLQKVDYVYHMRGWVKSLNDVNNLGSDLFACSFKFEEAPEGNVVVGELYNGSLKQFIWKSAFNNIKKSYVYEYDKLGRFTRSHYRDGSTLMASAGKFESMEIEYDSNGNIRQAKHNNQSGLLMDKLSYGYNDGNQLAYINDSTSNTDGFYDGNSSPDDYSYDGNGNLTKDRNKYIDIGYNHLDLVNKVVFGNGNVIEFVYDSRGTKLQMKTSVSGGATTTVDYLDGFQYTNTQLKLFPTSEGYVSVSGSNFRYVYIFKDQLGNNRLSYSDIDNNGIVTVAEIQSNTDYYVMGLTHFGEFVSDSNYNYKFQGKEMLAFSGYNMYDFGSRMYDPSVGRWFNVDPKNQFVSPYTAMGNYWTFSIDPNGEEVITVSAIVIGALIGAAMAAATYSMPAIMEGNWNWKDFGKSVAVGAISGAISAGLSSAGSQLADAAIAKGGSGLFWQSSTFSMMSSVTSQVGTSIAMGDPVTTGTIVGAAAAGFVTAKLPQWEAVKGGYFANAAGELVHNGARGLITGVVAGVSAGLVDGDYDNLGERAMVGAKYGAMGSISQTMGLITVFGSTRQLTNEQQTSIKKVQDLLGFKGRYVVRRGGLYQVFIKREVVWGNNIMANSKTTPETYGHEYGHIYQFYTQGWANYQGKGLSEQMKDTFNKDVDVYNDPGMNYNEYNAEEWLHQSGGGCSCPSPPYSPNCCTH